MPGVHAVNGYYLNISQVSSDNKKDITLIYNTGLETIKVIGLVNRVHYFC